jgi:hypothetical protein
MTQIEKRARGTERILESRNLYATNEPDSVLYLCPSASSADKSSSKAESQKESSADGEKWGRWGRAAPTGRDENARATPRGGGLNGD